MSLELLVRPLFLSVCSLDCFQYPVYQPSLHLSHPVYRLGYPAVAPAPAVAAVDGAIVEAAPATEAVAAPVEEVAAVVEAAPAVSVERIVTEVKEKQRIQSYGG